MIMPAAYNVANGHIFITIIGHVTHTAGSNRLTIILKVINGF